MTVLPADYLDPNYQNITLPSSLVVKTTRIRQNRRQVALRKIVDEKSPHFSSMLTENFGVLSHPYLKGIDGVAIVNNAAHVVYKNWREVIRPLSETITKHSFLERVDIAGMVLDALTFLDKNTPNPYASLDPHSIFMWGKEFNIPELLDYGLYKYSKSSKSLWTAPELFEESSPDESAANVYAFGTLLWFLIFQEKPHIEIDGHKYDGLDAFESAKSYNKTPPCTSFPAPPTTFPPFKDQVFKSHVTKLLQQCWQQEPFRRPSIHQVQKEFQRIITASLIHDEIGVQFWLENFPGKILSVHWEDEFFPKLINSSLVFDREFMIVNEYEFERLFLEMIAPQLQVTVMDFSLLLYRFGPLHLKLETFLKDIWTMLTLPGFHGDISSMDAAKALSGKPVGTYLIRFSSSIPGSYAISKVAAYNQPQHNLIDYKGGSGFVLGTETFASMGELIKQNKSLVSPLEGKYEKLRKDLKNSDRKFF